MRIGSVNPIHVVPLFIRDHFECKLVMIAQKHRPLAVLGNRRSLVQYVDNRKAIFHLQRHEHARHERKVKIHMRLVASAKISRRVFGPLVGLCQQHAVRELPIDVGA